MGIFKPLRLKEIILTYFSYCMRLSKPWEKRPRQVNSENVR